MNPQVQQAGQQLAPVYNQAQGQLAQQMPAIANLYQSLIQGLQGQTQAQVQNVVNSAAQRGVLSGQTQLNAQGALDQALAQQTGQLSAQQAQETAAAKFGIGKLNAQRQNDILNLANSLQDLSTTKKKAAMDRLQNERQHQLDMLQAQQNYNIQQANFNTQQARASARQAASAKDISQISEGQIQRQLRISLDNMRGSDNHVGPKDLAKAYLVWQEAGLNPSSFWKNYQGLWNPKQKDYGDQFHFFVANPQKALQ